MADRALSSRYISVQWRLLLPVFIGLLIAVMAGAYALGHSLSQAAAVPQTNLLIQTNDAIRNRAADLYEQMHLEAERIVFTRGVADFVRNRAALELQPILESSARLANLDSIVVADSQGIEVVGVLRQQSGAAYSVSTGTDLHVQSVVRTILDENAGSGSGLLRTPSGLLLYTAVPLLEGDQRIGMVLIGRALDGVLSDLKADGIASIALYDSEAKLLQTTTRPADIVGSEMPLPADEYQKLAATPDQLIFQSVQLNNSNYQVAFTTFQFGNQPIGFVATFLSDGVGVITQMGQQLGGLTLATVAAAAVIALFIATYVLIVSPATDVTTVAQSLAAGNSFRRTGMRPTNEVTSVGHALDQYADYVQDRHDALRTSLRRQRREAEYLMSILEMIPDGIVVHDQYGEIIVMNEQARKLLGTQTQDILGLREISRNDSKSGQPLAPGFYTLGDPRRLELGDHMISAQAAALVNFSDERVGTVVVLRDITKEMRREQMQEIMLKRLSDEVMISAHVPMRAEPSLVNNVALDLAKHTGAIQKLIYEMRELTMPNTPALQEAQRPLSVDTLIWVIANDWRQIASAANLSLEVLIEKRDLFILGDERRLRWAVGNLIDNAIKYTLPGGKLTLEVNGESSGRALMRVRDNGVGVSREDLPNLTTRFYRGVPRTSEGDIIRVPGTGQGLYVAKHVIEAHGGLLQIKSKPGVGTAVYFALPVTSPMSYELPVLPRDLDIEGETVRLQRSNL